jgi:hypothetical protein
VLIPFTRFPKGNLAEWILSFKQSLTDSINFIKFTIMACACIGVYRKERLDESYREILRQYQKYVIEDTCWFSIELE